MKRSKFSDEQIIYALRQAGSGPALRTDVMYGSHPTAL